MSKSRPPVGAPTPPALGGDERVLLFADSLEQLRREPEQAHQWESWLTLGLDQERLAIPVAQVLEVVRPGAITKVPHAPYPVRGVTSLRGGVIAVVDLRLRLGLPSRADDEASRIVVVSSQGRRIGLLVDRAEQVTTIDALRIEPAPDDVLSERSYFVHGVYRRDHDLLVLLALDQVLQVRAADDRALGLPEDGGPA